MDQMGNIWLGKQIQKYNLIKLKTHESQTVSTLE